MKIGIFGGSFDPVHKGHIALARQACESGAVDLVVFMPAANQPFKLDRCPADGQDRINMIRAAISGIHGLEVSDYELSNPEEVSYTIKTLKAMEKRYGPEHKIHFILGADSFLKIHTWMRAEELLSKYPLIVGVRPGFPKNELETQECFLRKTYGTEIIWLHNPLLDISSTAIRDGIAEQLNTVPEKVKEYILEQGLYY